MGRGDENCRVLFSQAFFPPWDVRAGYAMETHGVTQTRLNGPPAQGGFLSSRSPGSRALQGKLLAFMPAILLLGTYVAVQVAQWLKVRPLPSCLCPMKHD